jgi:asparagine synthase (glutamine-hydrolysing)
MCGIAGMFGDSDAALLGRMLDVLQHRGPDDRGTFLDDGVALGQTRLSIVDVSGGHQPILDESGARCIVVNGEVYNHRTLAATLDGHTLRTRADSEVPLHLYEDRGPEAVALLDGMFALALWDGRRLFLARDRVGIKPLYFAKVGGTLYFASEIKALLPITANIREFPPGHWYRSDQGFQPFADWSLDAFQAPLEEAMAGIRERLEAGVVKRLMADVPLGTFCSGGLDSTLVTALAARHLPRFHTFSTGMAGAPDLENAVRASAALGTEHHVREYTEDEVLAALPNVAWHLESFDAALLRSAIPTFFVSELARQHVKVVLTGEGADELYAGYAYLKALKGQSLHDELARTTRALHHLNLQRTDRMTMAHGLEGRVPFLDWSHILHALSLPPEWKIGPDGTEKWILRDAFRGLLPKDLLHRPKQKFSEGAGSADVIRHEAERQIDDREFDHLGADAPVTLRTKEEAFAYRLFAERFPPEVAALCLGQTSVY